MRVLAAAAAFAVANAAPFEVTRTEEAVSCPNDVCSLRMSTSWELLRLVRSDGIVLGRTYHGSTSWEELKKETHPLTDLAACQTAWCFTKEASFTYTIESSVVSTIGIDVEEHQAARFFQQATFGATEADIFAFKSQIMSSGVKGSRLQWFDTQVALSPTLARVYARKRMNPRFVEPMAGEFFQPAEEGSRWHKYAFSTRDEGKILRISRISGTGADDYKGLVKVSTNVLELNSPDLNAMGTMLTLTEVSGAVWHAIQAAGPEFQVCEVDEGTEAEGSTATLAAAGRCKDNGVKTSAPNVEIAFADPATVSTMCLATQKLEWAKMRLEWLSRGSMQAHTLIMQDFDRNSLLNTQADKYRFPVALQSAASLDAIYFLRVEDTNTYFRYDARLKLLTNTEESPTSAGAAAVNPGDECPAVAVDVMNPKQLCNTNSGPAAVFKSDCSGNARVTCGQRGEVANDPNFGNRYGFLMQPDQAVDGSIAGRRTALQRGLDYYYYLDNGQTQPFHNIAFSSSDQLRQRVTWALFQKIPISVDLGRVGLVEGWQQYMDIFASNAFGNYRDILQEVSTSPLMGMYLSFVMNKAYASDNRLPDQNYAREVMQLFSIGMTKLNMDGTPVVDSLGESVPTYVNRDIVTFARIWTGFKHIITARGAGRGNIESFVASSELDSMPITGADRDAFPKTDLTGGYIGDGYPLCKDLPPKHFLKKGARYVYSGNSSVEGDDYDSRRSLDNFEYKSYGPISYELIVAGTQARCVWGTHCGDMSNPTDAKIEIHVEGAPPPTGPATDSTTIDGNEIYIRGEQPPGTVSFSYPNGCQGAQCIQAFKVHRVQKLYDEATSNRPARVIFAPYRENKMEPWWYADAIIHINSIFPPGTKLTFHNSPEGTAPPSSLDQYTAAVGTPLQQKLCSAAQGGVCSFPPVVNLQTSLQCTDDLCDKLQDLTTVKVKADSSASEWHYYTYVPPPCTKLSIFDGKLIQRRGQFLNPVTRFTSQCSNPAVPVAGTMCCLKDKDTPRWTVPMKFYKPPFCNVLGERMTFNEAQMRCASLGVGAKLCETPLGFHQKVDYANSCGEQQYSWTQNSCSIKVQVKAEGLVNLVVDEDDTGRFEEHTMNDFYPVWDALQRPQGLTGPNFPEPKKAQTPGVSVCKEVMNDGATTLVCSVTIEDTAVFADSNSLEQVKAQGKEKVESMLSIGAVDPSEQGSDYTLLGSAVSDVTAWVKGGQWRWTNAMDVIIGVKQPQPRGGGYKYYMNRRSTVWINKNPDGNSWAYSFRNPPTFMRLVGEGDSPGVGKAQEEVGKVRDQYAAAAETSALLDHLFYHQSMAPFLARHLIQRMVTSNPSPAYIERVATAFVEGTYGVGNDVRGSGAYGCLKATIAAVLLDSEATSSVLEADPSFGHVHEPFLKVMRVLKSLHYQPLQGQEILLKDLQGKIGQGAFGQPSVFGYYLPDYIPKGPLADVHLVSPESELLVAPPLFGLLNGLTSLVTSGLHHCSGGFGFDKVGLSEKSRQNCLPDGSLTWTSGETTQTWDSDKALSAGRIVDKLDLLLTSGRLAARSKQLITDAVVTPARTLAQAETLAIELVLATAEFHSTGFSLPAPSVTPPTPPPPTYDPFSLSDYKVVVIVLKLGGADSWNYLIPGQSQYCRGTVSYNEYATRRGSAAIPIAELSAMEIQLPGVPQVPSASAQQPCSRFYVHPYLTSIRDAYNAGDAAFFANIGNLAEPMTKDTLKTKKEVLPLNLFSHDQQQRQAQTLDPLARTNVNGVMGKMADALAANKRTDIFGFGQYWKALEADSATAMVLDQKKGTKDLQGVYQTAVSAVDAPVNQLIKEARGTRSHFAETYCKVLRHGLQTTSELKGKLDAAKQSWEDARTAGGQKPFGDDRVSSQFAVMSQVINLRKTDARRSHRDVFVVTTKGFDTHNTYTPPDDLKGIDSGIGAFREEMMRQGLWDQTVVVTISEFGRALPPNAAGTDHGWGGHYVAVGGKVKQTILGQYPSSLTIDNEMDNGHGTTIPYRGWEAMWAPIIDWFGVPSDKHEEILPNLRNFPEFQQGADLKGTLFES